MSMQLGLGFGYSAWQPIELNGTAPHVQAPCYSQVFVADFIGTAPEVQVSNIDLKRKNLSAYAGYESGKLAKVAVVNLDEWNSTTPRPRPVQAITLPIPQEVSQVKVEKLTGPGASSFDHVTWAGMSWTYANKGLGEQALNDTAVVEVVNSTVQLEVQSTEAVLVTMIRG